MPQYAAATCKLSHILSVSSNINELAVRPRTHEFFQVQAVWHAHATIYSIGVAFEDTLLVGIEQEAKGKVAPEVERTA